MPRPRSRLRKRPQESLPKTPSKPAATKPDARAAASTTLKAKVPSTPTTSAIFDTTNILAELTPPMGAAGQKGSASFVNRLASSPPPLHPPSSPPVDIVDTQEIENDDYGVIESNAQDLESEVAVINAKETVSLPSALPMTDEDPFGFASADTVLEPTAFKKPTFSTAQAVELLSSPRKRRRFQAPHHNGVRSASGTPAEFTYLNAFSDISSPARPTSTIQDDTDQEEAVTAAAVLSDAIVISSDAPDRETVASAVAPSIEELIRILPPRQHHSDSEELMPSSSTPLSPGAHGGAPSDDEYDAEERAGRRKRRRQKQRAAERREEEDSALVAQRAEEKRRENEARTQRLRDKFKEIDQWQLTEETVPANTSSLEEEGTSSATQGESQG